MSKRKQHESWSNGAGDDPLKQATGVALDALRDAATYRGVTPKLGLVVLVDVDDQMVTCTPHGQPIEDTASLLICALEQLGARVAVIHGPGGQG